ncbi:MAG: thioredoxin-dependent thiol peroxidase [Spirochaetales bacterium]
MKQVGEKVENFTLVDADGKEVSLSEFAGKKKVIYFYPKDDTPGCTKEACGFRDVYSQITGKGAVVIGISADPVEKHARFRDKYQLPFVLLSDPEKKVIEDFGALGEKKMYGKTYLGILRSTFVLDEEDRITHVFPKVKPEGHAGEILAALGE